MAAGAGERSGKREIEQWSRGLASYDYRKHVTIPTDGRTPSLTSTPFLPSSLSSPMAYLKPFAIHPHCYSIGHFPSAAKILCSVTPNPASEEDLWIAHITSAEMTSSKDRCSM